MTHQVVQFLSLRQSSAYDYQRDDNSLVMVGGEVCNGAVWCNDYSNKTLITKDGGNSFEELAQIPTEIKGHCVVFLDNNTLMVIGGYYFPNAVRETYFLDIPSNVWTTGPPLLTTRAYHTCNVITDCEDKRQGGDSIEKFQLEVWLEKSLKFWLEISYTKKKFKSW